MGVGVPFGLGAKAAKPDKQVLVLHGDGSFGMNAMEMDTAFATTRWSPSSVQWRLTADPEGGKMAVTWVTHREMMDAFGGHSEYVETPGIFVPP
jgi:acetolactate synthase-1/2/3 large subunit